MQKFDLPQKLSGIYEHHTFHKRTPLVRGFDDVFYVPHSRYTGVSKEDIAALKAAPGPKASEYSDEVRTVDVVVCGAGAGGLAAAIEAKLAGADVVIVEKQGITGGATARSGGKLLGAGTKWQKKQGLYDTKDMVYDYLMDVGNRNGKFMDASKNRYLVDHLNQTLDWLTSIEATVKGDPAEVLAQPWEPLSKPVEKDGVLKTHFDVLDVEPIHVSLQPWRVHNSPGGGGQTNGEGGEISTPLTLYYENDLGGEIIYDTAMNEILTDEAGVVTGVTCTRKGGAKLTLYARKGVILATGGYARNKEMVARYPVAHYFSNVPHGNVGDGLTAAEKIGALNYEHPAVQVVYTSLTCGIGINDESGLIVNDRGERVVNEWSYQYTLRQQLRLVYHQRQRALRRRAVRLQVRCRRQVQRSLRHLHRGPGQEDGLRPGHAAGDL